MVFLRFSLWNPHLNRHFIHRKSPRKKYARLPLSWSVVPEAQGKSPVILMEHHYLHRSINYWLVVSTPLKNISQLGWLFPIYEKINKPSVVSPTAATLYFCKPFWSVLRSQALEPSPERCWTWLGSAPKPPRPSREPSEPSPRPH